MRHSILAALLAALFWAALPLLCLGSEAEAPAPETAPPLPPVTEASALPADPAASDAGAVRGFDEGYRLPVLREGRVERMDLHSYLTGVLLAELPASFDDESFKAQAVASRTYALRSCARRRHEDAALCTDSGCCQGWRDPAEAEPWAREKAEAALRATDGLVLRYHGELIEATFFSCSGGRTEAAAAVWGSELPYLQAVDSPGEEIAAHDRDELRIPLEEFVSKLRALDGAVALEGPQESWIGAVSYTPGGGVDSLELGGRSFRGTALRRCFGLPSTVFSLALTEEAAVFSTRGYGHRVGMSQYGAEAMARAGNDYETILKWYYTGVELGPAE